MSDVLRLQGKAQKDVQRYLEAAKAKGAADKELARSIAVGDALALERDGKLDDAAKALAGVDGAGDTRVQQELAMVAYAQGKPADAKPFVDQILASTPDHDVARALQKRLETSVAKTDPMPNEGSGSVHEQVHHDPTPPNTNSGGGGGDYDTLVGKADKLAVSNCSSAMTVYGKALEQKPTGVEALTGMGYCYLNGKQFASAFSKFRSALAVSQRFEPALAGVAETYQQQGNRDQAVEAWQRYLEAYPGSAKATKQLQILGAGATPTPPTPTPTPTPTPPPTNSGGDTPSPTSQPQKPAAGDGSAS
jgi:tetratricopeptide (TPR) repeat protein